VVLVYSSRYLLPGGLISLVSAALAVVAARLSDA
jgi:hypothetical protein